MQVSDLVTNLQEKLAGLLAMDQDATITTVMYCTEHGDSEANEYFSLDMIRTDQDTEDDDEEGSDPDPD